jgi:hypothetical protein
VTVRTKVVFSSVGCVEMPPSSLEVLRQQFREKEGDLVTPRDNFHTNFKSNFPGGKGKGLIRDSLPEMKKGPHFGPFLTPPGRFVRRFTDRKMFAS